MRGSIATKTPPHVHLGRHSGTITTRPAGGAALSHIRSEVSDSTHRVGLRVLTNPTEKGGRTMTGQRDLAKVDRTRDKDYNVIWFTEQCLSNALRLEPTSRTRTVTVTRSSSEFFRRAQAESKKGGRPGQGATGQKAVRLRPLRRYAAIGVAASSAGPTPCRLCELQDLPAGLWPPVSSKPGPARPPTARAPAWGWPRSSSLRRLFAVP